MISNNNNNVDAEEEGDIVSQLRQTYHHQQQQQQQQKSWVSLTTPTPTFGLGTPPKKTPVYECIIIGGGMAGCTCAVYLAQAGIQHVLVTGPSLGALQESPSIRNWPSLINVPGRHIMEALRAQVQLSGSWVLPESVTRIDMTRWPFSVWVQPHSLLRTKTIVMAMGSEARKHQAKNVQRLWGHGVYSCAVCDGFKYAGKPVAVIGGGDSAIGTASYLARIASRVYLIVRSKNFKSKDVVALQKLLTQSKVHPHTSTNLIEVVATPDQKGVKAIIVESTSRISIPVAAVFIAIGSDPLTQLVETQLQLDEDRFITVDPQTQESSIKGVFAIGEIASSSKPFLQAITAAAEGCKASFGVRRFLSEKSNGRTPPPKVGPPPGTLSRLTMQQREALQQLGQQVDVLGDDSQPLSPSRTPVFPSDKTPRTMRIIQTLEESQAFIQEAKKQHKKILVDFFSPQCGPCQLTKNRLQPWMSQIPMMAIDVVPNLAMANEILKQVTNQKHTQVESLPTLVWYNPTNGQFFLKQGLPSETLLQSWFKDA